MNLLPAGSLFPAVPVPMLVGRNIDWEAQELLAQSIAASPVSGAAVWAHTGRGLLHKREERIRILQCWRDALQQRSIVAGIGGDRTILDDADYLRSALVMAEDAAANGAAFLLCHPPRYQSSEDIQVYYGELSRLGIPLILFYLYPQAGGQFYDDEMLRTLLQLPNITGMKLATLNDVMRYQDVTEILTKEYPKITLITGEDRFLGYSIMMGATAGLLGMSTIFPTLQHELFAAFNRKELERFYYLSKICDEIGRAIFAAPMEAYIGRLLYALAKLGVIPSDSGLDPFGPALTPEDRAKVDSLIASLPEEALAEYR